MNNEAEQRRNRERIRRQKQSPQARSQHAEAERTRIATRAELDPEAAEYARSQRSEAERTRLATRAALDPEAAEYARSQRSEAERTRRASFSPDDVVTLRNQDTTARQRARFAMPEEAIAALRDQDTTARQNARRPVATFVRAAPTNMPSIESFLQMETDPIAGASVLWARFGNHVFADFRDDDFQNMTSERADVLKAAMEEEAYVFDEDIERCTQSFFSRVSPNKPASACGCCGVMDIEVDINTNAGQLPFSELKRNNMSIVSFHTVPLNSPLLFVLRYTTEQENTYNLFVPEHIIDNEINRDRWTRFKRIISMFVVNFNNISTRYHLYPELCSTRTNTTQICEECYTELNNPRGSRIPVPSIAAGWDIGSAERAGLPELTFAETLCISKVRVYSAALNFRLPRTSSPAYNTFRGHVISFPQDAPIQCGNIMPNLQFAEQTIEVTVEGPQGMTHHTRLEFLFRRLGALKAAPINVLTWLHALHFLSPIFRSIIVNENINGEFNNDLHQFRNRIFRNASLMPYPSRQTEIDRDVATSDITNPQLRINAVVSGDQIMEGLQSHSELNPAATLLTQRFIAQNIEQSNIRVLSSIRQATATGSINNSSTQQDDVPELLQPVRTRPIIPLHRDEQPMNDFMEQSNILYGAFPTVFPLGMGVGVSLGPLDLKTRRFLLRHFSRRPAKNQLLLIQLHNTKQRADAGRVMAASVRTDQLPLNRFFEIVNNPNYANRLANAINTPTSDEARLLVRELSPLIMTTASRIPFSPMERGTRAASELLAMVRCYGLPNAFLTLGFDEKRTAIIARIAFAHGERNVETTSAREFWGCPASYNTFFDEVNTLPTERQHATPDIEIWRTQVGEAIGNDPAAISLMCQRLVDALLEELIGVPSNKRKTPSDFTTRQKGCFGRARAWFNVTEVIFVYIKYKHV